MSSVMKKSDWANLPAEELRDVIKRLEETRPYRKETLETEFLSKQLTFLLSLKQPGPKDETIQCLIKRNKFNLTYHLYLSTPGTLVESGKFLLSAKRTWRTTCTEYVISMDANNISESSSIGKIRSNFPGTKYIIHETRSAYNPQNRTHGWFKSKKVSPKVPSGGNNNISQVNYELNVLGTRGPRKMHCIMDSIVEKDREQPLVLRNKQPRWHEKLQCWCLDFKRRVTIASIKNFQLMTVHSGADEEILLQFGKVDKDVFTMDYRYPLSAFQAFAICLTSFDTKLACE